MALRFYGSGGQGTNWGCSYCKGPDFEEQDNQREIRNCEGEDTEKLNKRGVYPLSFPWGSACPNTYFDDSEIQFYLYTYSNWKLTGEVPWKTVHDAPAPVFQALQLMEETMKEVEVQKQREQQQKLEKQQKTIQSKNKGRRR